jgi:hypothetical protein
MTLHVRDASPDDAQTISDFNSRMASETEDRLLDPELIDSGVAAILADSSKGRYWVAEADGNVVGQIMVATNGAIGEMPHSGGLEAFMYMRNTAEKGCSRPCIAM